jgi:hypothetical protein
MNLADKNRLKAAFTKALENSPKADLPLGEGFFDKEGKPLTLRKAVEGSLESGELYDVIDKAIKGGRTTLDDVIKNIKL